MSAFIKYEDVKVIAKVKYILLKEKIELYNSRILFSSLLTSKHFVVLQSGYYYVF